MAKAKKQTVAGVMPAKINIGGRQLPCRVTMGAMRRFKAVAGHDISELVTDNLDELLLFIWCCVASACNADKIDFDLSSDDFADHLEPDALTEFMDTMPTEQKKTTATP